MPIGSSSALSPANETAARDQTNRGELALDLGKAVGQAAEAAPVVAAA